MEREHSKSSFGEHFPAHNDSFATKAFNLIRALKKKPTLFGIQSHTSNGIFSWLSGKLIDIMTY